MGNSFQYPLPWEHCPTDVTTNDTGTEVTDEHNEMWGPADTSLTVFSVICP